MTAPTNVLVTPAPSGTCSSPSRCSQLSPKMHSAQWSPAGVSTPGCIPQRARGALVTGGVPFGAPVKPGRRKRRESSPSRRTPGDPLQEGAPVGPPGSRLFQAVDSELAECPGGGQSPAHGEGRLSGGKVVLCLKLFGCLGACVPGSGRCRGEGVWCGGEPWHTHLALECTLLKASLSGDLVPEKQGRCWHSCSLLTCVLTCVCVCSRMRVCSHMRMCSCVCSCVCMCSRVCSCICAHVCALVLMCALTCVCAHVCSRMCMCSCVLTCMYVLVCAHICVLVLMCVHSHVYVLVCVLTCVCSHVHVCSCVSAHVCAHMCTPTSALIRALLLLTS